MDEFLNDGDAVDRALNAADGSLLKGKRAIRKLEAVELTRLVQAVGASLVRLHTEDLFDQAQKILSGCDMDSFMAVKSLVILKGPEFCEAVERDPTKLVAISDTIRERLWLGEEFVTWLRDYYNKRTGSSWEVPDDSGIFDLKLAPHRTAMAERPQDHGQATSPIFLSFDRALERIACPRRERIEEEIESMPIGASVRLEYWDGVLIGEVTYNANRTYSLDAKATHVTGGLQFTVSSKHAAGFLAQLIPPNPVAHESPGRDAKD